MSLFLDFDKEDEIFYNNLYLEEYKIVIKMPINPNEDSRKHFKVEEFNLANYTYLLDY